MNNKNNSITENESHSKIYNFNYEWKFKLADHFPLNEALDEWKDDSGRYFYEKEYDE